MKKLTLAVLFLLFTNQLFAQDRFGNYGFRLGLTAHPNFGFIKVENGKGNGVSLGFAYGLIGDFHFAENYSFTTGLTITTINGKSTEVNPSIALSGNPAANGYELKYKMQYIEIPLTIKLKTVEMNGIRWFGQFGLSNDIRLSSRLDISYGSTAVSDNIDGADYTNTYRGGMIIGGGGEFSVANHTSVVLGLTFNNGFTNLTAGDNKVRNHYVGLNFGVFF